MTPKRSSKLPTRTSKSKKHLFLRGASSSRRLTHSVSLRALALLSVAALWIIITGHIDPIFAEPGGITNIFHPLSQPAQQIKELSLLVVAICATIFVIVAGLLVYTII